MVLEAPSLNVVKLSDCIGPAFHDLYRELRDQEEKLAAGLPVDDQIYELWENGGRGSLKSSFASILIANGLRLDPYAHAICMRRWENDMRDSVFSQMKWAFDKLGMYGDWQFIARPMEARNKRTGQVILFKGGDDPIKLKSIKLPRGYVKYLWMEEANQFRSAEDLRNVEQSVFRGERSNKTLSIYSYNPPKSEREWVNKEVRTPMPGRRVHSSTYLEAPRAWLGERFIQRAEALRDINPAAYENEYLGKVTGTGTEVFTNIKAVRFTTNETEAMTNVRQGLDWGYSINPLALICTSYNARTNVLRIFKETFMHTTSNAKLDDVSDVDTKSTITYADSAEPKSCDEMRKYGWKLVNAYKPKNSVRQGIKWLQGMTAIEIDLVACPHTLNEFLTYNYVIAQDGQILDDFPDENNHTIDAVRYSQQENIFILNQTEANIKLSTGGVKNYWNRSP
jgi:phage terminase large subunit